MSRAQHWGTVYRTKSETEVSWHEEQPTTSVELIQSVLPSGESVIDIGGGASRLADRLLTQGSFRVTVLDVPEVALHKARSRLGAEADRVRWVTGDVTTLADAGQYDVWHDRAVFHFLSDPVERRRCASLAAQGVFLGVTSFWAPSRRRGR